ncbi:unnamed protein product [Darwinula stevensoni]|uniref:Uncharacterized protein n=1 Tax=Darwinula stevensoni TaxID=69355 RepID=A0A7R9A590_9CRUS|nr:unnamed protein product [Darwinula stevensoni]CAG0895141.1 unnamed protein product [Darwinula stevensoni]
MCAYGDTRERFRLQILGAAALALFRVAQDIRSEPPQEVGRSRDPVEPDLDMSNVIVGTLVGLFLSNLVRSVAHLVDLDHESAEVLHEVVSALFYTMAGIILIGNTRHSCSTQGDDFLLACGIVCLFVGVFYFADALLSGQKGRSIKE